MTNSGRSSLSDLWLIYKWIMCGTYGNVCIKKSENTQEGTKMTRLQRELNGSLGVHWRESALKEIARMQEKADNGEILIDENGAASWKSNGRALPGDCCEKLAYTSVTFSAEATAAKREAENDAFLESYRKANHRHSEEELNEMWAVFGTATVVDIITGERIRL